MTPTRKLVGAGAFSLALAGGALTGAVLGTPSLTSAQDASAASAIESEAETDAPRRGRHLRLGEGLAVAAEALGMEVGDLKAQLRAGRSIADVAEQQDVDLDTVVDALVAHGLERLAEAEAALPGRVEEMVNRRGRGDDRPGRPGRPGHPGAERHLFEAAAGAIEITPVEID